MACKGIKKGNNSKLTSQQSKGLLGMGGVSTTREVHAKLKHNNFASVQSAQSQSANNSVRNSMNFTKKNEQVNPKVHTGPNSISTADVASTVYKNIQKVKQKTNKDDA